MPDADAAEDVHGAGEAVEVVGRVRDRDHFDAGVHDVPPPGVFDVRAVHAQHQFRAGRERRVHLLRVEAVDGNSEPISLERANGVSEAVPRGAGVAAEVDEVGPAGAVAAGFREDRVRRLLRGVVPLRENLDVEHAVPRWGTGFLTEELRQVAQVVRAAHGRCPGGACHLFHLAAAQAGEDDAVEVRRERGQVPGDPVGRQERGDGDRQNGDVGLEPDGAVEFAEGAAEGRFGQLPGDEQEAGPTGRHAKGTGAGVGATGAASGTGGEGLASA